MRQPIAHTIPLLNQSPATKQLVKDVESSQGGSEDMDDSTIVEIIQRPTMHKTKSNVSKPNN